MLKDYKDILKEYSKKQDIGLTPKILKVSEIVFDIHAHFTEEDILEHLEILEINLDELEIILLLLLNAGLIRKICFEDKCFYEHIYGHAHHDHLYCMNCGEIIGFNSPLIEKEQAHIAKTKGYELIKHTLKLVGICSNCQKKKAKEQASSSFEISENFTNDKILPLSLITPGQKVIVTEIAGGKSILERLRSMGITPGQEVKVFSNDFQGPFVLMVGNSRIAIGHGMAHKILVRKK